MVLVLRSEGNKGDAAWRPEIYLLLQRKSFICHHHHAEDDDEDDDDVVKVSS